MGATSTIKDCDTTSVFRPVTLGLSPDPPVRGAPVYMTVEFENTGSTITEGTATTAFSLNYIPLTPSTKPLCEDTECPIVTGFNNRSTASVWPDTISGKIASKITWVSSDGRSLLCIQLTANVAKIENKLSNSTALVPYYRILRHGAAPKHKKANHTKEPVSSTTSSNTGSNTNPNPESPTINNKAILNAFLNKITGSSGTSDSNSDSQESHPTYTLRRVGGHRHAKKVQDIHH
jgi:hypothetical protein